MTREPRITVVVCTYNRAEVLGNCLDSLLVQDYPEDAYEVLVVDDGSTDDTASVVASRRETQSRVAVRFAWQENAGLNAARNLGVGEARGELVSFFDDDELAPPEHLARIARHMDSDPALDGVGGPYRDHLESGADLPTCSECSLAAHAMPFDRPTAVSHLFGGNMTLRRRCFAKVGPFDEEISRQGSARGDESEWFSRAAGDLRLLYDPELWIWHRRDLFDLRTLLRHSFMQGTAAPEIVRRQGARFRPRPNRLLRGVGHALRRRCTQGLVIAARELGAWAGWFKRAGSRKTNGGR